MSHKKKKVFTFAEKQHILWRLETGEQNKDIAKEYGVPHSTISMMWKRRKDIKDFFKNNSLKMKRARASKHSDIENALLKWYKDQKVNNFYVNGTILQQKANHIASLMGKKKIQCSASWIQRFRARHNIVSDTVSRERIVSEIVSHEVPSVSEELNKEWLAQEWPALCEGYTPENIFNADETGLFFNLTPDKTLIFKGAKCKGGQFSKKRVTVLVTANMTGSQKEKLLVIGKAKRIQCLKNEQSLPVYYEYNSNSLMTSQIFEKWLRNWDAQLKSRGNKILLLVDGCGAHRVVRNLNCIKLVFLPGYVNVSQPMDQGVIKSLKTQYRRLQVLQMLLNNENADRTKSLSILDAILIISEAWEKVSQTTIADCFHHAGFKESSISPHVGEDDDIVLSRTKTIQSSRDVHYDIPLSQLAAQFIVWSNSKIELEDFIDVDDKVLVCGPVIDENLTESISNSSNSDNEEEDDIEHFQSPSLSKAIDAITTLQKFVTFNQEFNCSVNQEVLKEMKHKMQNSFEINFMKSSQSDRFFNNNN